jgi:hypothetical protein
LQFRIGALQLVRVRLRFLCFLITRIGRVGRRELRFDFQRRRRRRG